jgi:hypothetical protein
MFIGEPKPKSLVDLDLACGGFVGNFLAGVSASACVVVVGDMGRLRFLDRLAGGFSGCSNVEGASLAILSSTFIVSGNGDRLGLRPKDGARLRVLGVAEAAKVSARFIF